MAFRIIRFHTSLCLAVALLFLAVDPATGASLAAMAGASGAGVVTVLPLASNATDRDSAAAPLVSVNVVPNQISAVSQGGYPASAADGSTGETGASVSVPTTQPENPEKGQHTPGRPGRWGMPPEGHGAGVAPVVVSTSNATISRINSTRLRNSTSPAANGTLLPGLNATMPESRPPSDMPQMAPITGW